MIIKSLFIVRHGHSEFDAAVDFERKLSSTGRAAALKTAHFISQKAQSLGFRIDEVICSAAWRTLETAEIICNTLNRIQPNKYKDLYATTTQNWLEKIQQSSAKSLVLVGHNPTMSQLSSLLSGSNDYMSPADCMFAEVEFKQDGVVVPVSHFESFKTN